MLYYNPCAHCAADYNSFARFFDNEVGRVDPDVFKVPKECRVRETCRARAKAHDVE